jgi:hypothetical protein
MLLAARLAVAVCLVVSTACTLGSCRGKPKPGTDPAPTAPIPTSARCDSLTRLECYSASHCVLEHVGPAKYVCRDPKGPCEVGLKQTDAKACNARAECTWTPGSCYCPFPGYGDTSVPERTGDVGGACACGGGPPPMCAEKAIAAGPPRTWPKDAPPMNDACTKHEECAMVVWDGPSPPDPCCDARMGYVAATRRYLEWFSDYRRQHCAGVTCPPSPLPGAEPIACARAARCVRGKCARACDDPSYKGAPSP